MPTAARLVAAVILAAMAWYVSDLIQPLMVEDPPHPRFQLINAGLGLLVGWTVIGSRARDTYVAAFAHGLTGAAAWVFWAMLAHSTIKMVELSLRKQYDDAMQAVVGVFEIALKDGQIMGSALVVTTIIIVGMGAGLAATWASRRFD
ncbi:TrgA family protein [Nereida sp. MMG025]|uniref:TrgA family protein n=1 Tax=Nereida sp. MMG025 TaxID=2909981 RepID=UPI001F463D98|nr:TrgA family protein [Nereida sp. MMG025]MCF6443421.1 TrgA family protein [Nereida sp. MMG025]